MRLKFIENLVSITFQYTLNLARLLEQHQHCHLLLVQVLLFREFGKLKLHKLNAGIQQGHMIPDVYNIMKAQPVELQVSILLSQVPQIISICIPKSKYLTRPVVISTTIIRSTKTRNWTESQILDQQEYFM